MGRRDSHFITKTSWINIQSKRDSSQASRGLFWCRFRRRSVAQVEDKHRIEDFKVRKFSSHRGFAKADPRLKVFQRFVFHRRTDS